MTIKVNISTPDLEGLARRITAAVVDSTRRVMPDLTERITDELRAGRKPDGSSQPDLDAGYLARKVAAGFPSTSGVRTGQLSNPNNWTVESLSSDALAEWRVEPPRDRADVVRFLQEREKQWEFVGVPESWMSELRASLIRGLDSAGG